MTNECSNAQNPKDEHGRNRGFDLWHPHEDVWFPSFRRAGCPSGRAGSPVHPFGTGNRQVSSDALAGARSGCLESPGKSARGQAHSKACGAGPSYARFGGGCSLIATVCHLLPQFSPKKYFWGVSGRLAGGRDKAKKYLKMAKNT